MRESARAVQSEKEVLESSFNKLKMESEMCKQEMEATLQCQLKELEALQSRKVELEAKVGSLEADLSKAVARNHELELEVGKLEAEMAVTKEEVEKLQAWFAEQDQKQFVVAAEVARLQSEIDQSAKANKAAVVAHEAELEMLKVNVDMVLEITRQRQLAAENELELSRVKQDFESLRTYVSTLVGILGNAADFQDNDLSSSTIASNNDRRKMMIAFDMRCVGFIMAKMVLRELMDPSTFFKFKSFLTKMLDRQWGAGWNLLALLLATKPEERISCVDALRHPFLCGPKWRINPSANLIRWGLGSTAVRMAEDYIYGRHQRRRLSYFVELMEVLNPSLRTQNWLHLLPGRWRLLYCTGRHIGLTLRQPSPRVLISAVYLTVSSESVDQVFSLTSDVGFRIMPEPNWPHDKSGSEGVLSVTASARIAAGRIYINEHDSKEDMVTSSMRYLHGNKWRKFSQIKELPSSLPAVNIAMDEIHVSISCTSTMTVNSAQKALKEIRTQTPPEMFDLSKIVCGTYIDARLMILRGVNGSTANCNPVSLKKDFFLQALHWWRSDVFLIQGATVGLSMYLLLSFDLVVVV
ncbi:putative plastid-lipid-associated protein 14 chloroplastic [Zea mays]|uniref:Putative plastid-lipid-associated protein 14 chloroplastic n=1 Tax=Zea mays TaxID=4577 RepID=A0A1D6NH00_MAIZE|nr:putative plastid-lipid-associated protein 14 chloroplastic [Zea mays]